MTTAQVWPLPAFRALERRVATWMVVFLVLINQAEVGMLVRLNFFSRDWFNAIQTKNEKAFWYQLIFVFLVWAFIYIFSAVVEFVVTSTLVIRWRRWLTGFYLDRWLDNHRITACRSSASRPITPTSVSPRISPLHRRRRGRLWNLFLLDPADLEPQLAGVLRHHPLDSLGELHFARYAYRRAGLPVLGRADLCRIGHVDHPFDREAAGDAILRATAL